MNSLSDWLDVIKRTALNAVEASKPVNVCFGVVKSTEPLKIFIDQKILLDEVRLVLTERVVENGLLENTGDLTAYATSFVGKIPYYYGAGRSYRTLEEIVAAGGMCDCSAYTERVFRHFGAEIGSTTYVQQNSGVAVNPSDIAEGDLLLFNNHSGSAQPGHVGIYIGNGQVVHEGGGNYKGNVKISPLSSFTVMSIRRIKTSAQNADNDKEITVHSRLVVGDRVLVLRIQGGQKYVVMDKIV